MTIGWGRCQGGRHQLSRRDIVDFRKLPNGQTVPPGDWCPHALDRNHMLVVGGFRERNTNNRSLCALMGGDLAL